MTDTKHPADVLDDAELVRAMAEAFEAVHGDAIDLRPVAAMLRRIPALEAERDQLRAEVEALRADAERYRHLTTSMGPHTTLCYDGKECIGKTEFDAVIDAARKQQ